MNKKKWNGIWYLPLNECQILVFLDQLKTVPRSDAGSKNRYIHKVQCCGYQKKDRRLQKPHTFRLGWLYEPGYQWQSGSWCTIPAMSRWGVESCYIWVTEEFLGCATLFDIFKVPEDHSMEVRKVAANCVTSGRLNETKNSAWCGGKTRMKEDQREMVVVLYDESWHRTVTENHLRGGYRQNW